MLVELLLEFVPMMTGPAPMITPTDVPAEYENPVCSA
jgi:hypothetical protein